MTLIYGYEDTNGDGQCNSGDRFKIYDPYLYSGKFNLRTRRGKATVEGNTVGQYKKLKSTTTLYSNSNLTGTKYYYLPKTRVKVIADYGNVNKIYVPSTGRYGFVSENVY